VSSNLTCLTGCLFERGALRHTPAGVPVVEFMLEHHSTQIEADVARKVDCVMDCVVMGPLAQLLTGARLGGALRATGFLAARGLKRKTPVLHVNTIEFLEGNENGIQTERQTRPQGQE
jgi:primosomal replication protein N